MKKILIAFIVLVSLTACTQTDRSERVLRDAGYSDIHITGYRIFGCGQGDHFHTGFEATAKATGNRVEGVVCSGMLKGATIRVD